LDDVEGMLYTLRMYDRDHPDLLREAIRRLGYDVSDSRAAEEAEDEIPVIDGGGPMVSTSISS